MIERLIVGKICRPNRISESLFVSLVPGLEEVPSFETPNTSGEILNILYVELSLVKKSPVGLTYGYPIFPERTRNCFSTN